MEDILKLIKTEIKKVDKPENKLDYHRFFREPFDHARPHLESNFYLFNSPVTGCFRYNTVSKYFRRIAVSGK